MAYTPNTLVRREGGFIEGSFNYWEYTTTDSVVTVLAAGYFSDGSSKGMKVGDLVLYANPTGTLPNLTRLQCSAVTTTTTGGLTQNVGSSTVVLADALLANYSVLPRNLIDGGDFTTNPWQIATSFNGTGGTAVLTADRWIANAGASLVWVASQASNTNVQGFSAAYQWGRSVGDVHTTGLTMGQVVETLDVIRLQGQPVTLSFWAGAGGNFAAGASGGTYLAQIIAGTGVNETYLKMVSASSWSGYTVIGSAAFTPGVSTYSRVPGLTTTVPTNATELGVAFSYQPTTAATSPGITAGANEWIQFIGMQLEVGPAPTSFEHLDVAEVVNITTRYLQVIKEPAANVMVGIAGYNGATSTAQVHVPLASPLRAAPTLTFTAGSFQIYDQANANHAVSAAGLKGATTGAVTLNVTAAAPFSAGGSPGGANCPAFLQGSAGSGIIILDADYA